VYLLILRRAVLRYIWRLLAGYRLPTGKHAGILTEIQTKVNQKMAKKALFLVAFFLLKSELYPL